jgi:hypothetical protein
MDKQLFDDAIGEVPSSTVDVDAVITRGRRADRVRRVVNPAVAAGVAVVLLTGAIAYTMTGDEGDGVRVGQTTTSTTSPAPTTSSAWPLPEACSRSDLETAGEVAARLTPLVQAKVQALRPDIQITVGPGVGYSSGVEHEPLEFVQVNYQGTADDTPICQRGSSFTASAATEGPEGEGVVFVEVRPADRDVPGDCTEEAVFCEKATGPNGDRILKKTTAQDGANMTQVDIIRPDGTYVIVGSNSPISDAPPLDHNQLIEVGTDPGMTLFP